MLRCKGLDFENDSRKHFLLNDVFFLDCVMQERTGKQEEEKEDEEDEEEEEAGRPHYTRPGNEFQNNAGV